MAEHEIRVLIVEDDADGADAIRQFLEFRGFAVVVAPSGEAALDALRGGPRFDVVITDQRLPGMSGSDLARRLCEEPGGRPRLIGLSGEHGQEERGPFDARLRKPCRPKVLVETIGLLLQGLG